jgi:serine/threonine protein kinase
MAGPGEKAAAGGGGAERRKYPIHVEDYELYEEIGQGVSAIVYRALCKPLDEIVAVKVLDFERTNSDLVRALHRSLSPSDPLRLVRWMLLRVTDCHGAHRNRTSAFRNQLFGPVMFRIMAWVDSFFLTKPSCVL